MTVWRNQEVTALVTGLIFHVEEHGLKAPQLRIWDLGIFTAAWYDSPQDVSF